jgi:ubiquinone/menaquinone biosynthesis C-methylase UbiE
MNEISQQDLEQLIQTSSIVSHIDKAEDPTTSSLVSLTKYADAFVLEVRCGAIDLIKLFLSEDVELIHSKFENYVHTLHEKGNPFLDNGMSKSELKELAKQLGNPAGEYGTQIGMMMNETNVSMIRKTFEFVAPQNKDAILELGHGNAHHLKELYGLATNLSYVGLDISKLMKKEAEAYCVENGLQATSSFQLYDGVTIPLESNSFDKIFTVNTLYFWTDPMKLMGELYRVLKPNGLLCITFVHEETMNKMPFTEYGFTKYDDMKFRKLLVDCAFRTVELNLHSEFIKSKFFGQIERKFFVATLVK